VISAGSCPPSQSLPVSPDFPGENGCNKLLRPDPCAPYMSVNKTGRNGCLSFRKATSSKHQFNLEEPDAVWCYDIIYYWAL